MNKLRILGVAIIAVVIAMLSATSHSQTVTGSVSGTVADSTGGLVAGAKVTLTNELTTQTREQDTGTSGDFNFTEIVPGTYDVTVEKDGFKTYAQRGIVVSTSETVPLHQIALEVGTITQEVTVAADAARVQTDTGAVTGLITPEQMNDLPNLNRNYLSTLQVLPGVTSGGSIGGGEHGQVLVQLDGIGFADNGVQGEGGNYTPNMEAIGEIKVMLNSYSAEYGARSGGQVNVSAKSGTNHFHGSGYDYLQNSWFNAGNYEFGAAPQRPKSRYNNPGYTIGGPIYIPKTNFDKSHNKLFFFWSQEFFPASSSGSVSYIRLPTAQELAGNFSTDQNVGTFPGSTAPQALYCPGWGPGSTWGGSAGIPMGQGGTGPSSNIYTACPAGLTSSNTPIVYPGYTVNPATLAYYQSVLPLPNNCSEAPGNTSTCELDSDNDDYVSGSSTSHNQELARFDWAVNSSTTAFIRGIRDFTTTTPIPDSHQLCQNGSSNCVFPLTEDTIAPTASYSIVGTLVHIFTPTMVNNFTVGFNLNIQSGDENHPSAVSRSALKVVNCSASTLSTCLPQFIPSADNVNGVAIGPYFSDGVSPALPFGNNDARFPFTGRQYERDYTDDFSWTLGQHALKFGFYVEQGLRNSALNSNFNGTYNFGHDSTDPLDTGWGLSNAFFGIIGSGGYLESNRKPESHGRYHDVDWYVQDDWKANRRLTLNLGIRFQHITPTISLGDQETNFVPSAWTTAKSSSAGIDQLIAPACQGIYPATGPCTAANPRAGYNPYTNSFVSPTLIGDYAANAIGAYPGTIYPGSVIFPKSTPPVDQPPIGVAPRLGFAYDVFGDGKTALRGGFGMFYDRNIGDDIFNMLLQQPPNLLSYSLPDTTVSDMQQLCNTGCNVNSLFLAPPVPSGPFATPGYQQNYKMPAAYEWSFGVQHDMGHGFLLDVAYDANVGRHRPMSEDINEVPYGTMYPTDAKVIDPTTGQPYTGNYADILRPYANAGQLSYYTFDGSTNYNSLQTHITRRFGKVLTFSGSWTYSKVLSYGTSGFFGGGWAPYIPRSRQYGVDANNRTHVVQLNWTYALPSLSSKWDNVFVREGLDGWQLTGLTTFQSGAPETIGMSIYQGASNITGGLDGQLATAVSISPSCTGVLQKHITVSCLETPSLTGSTPGLGNASLKQVLVGPGTNNWDVSLFKVFTLGKSETRNIELRAETYNTWNHAQFTGMNTSWAITESGTLGGSGSSAPSLTPGAYGPGTRNQTFLQYTGAAAPRTMQMVLKVHF